MLVIRKQQMSVFEREHRCKLVDALLAHVSDCFDIVVGQLGQERTRLVIEQALERAERYGIETDADFCEFVNLVFVFGDRFPDGAQFAWARELLGAAGGRTPEQRLARLRAETLAILDARAQSGLEEN